MSLGPICEAMPLPVLLMSFDGRILGLNDAAEIWLNVSRRFGRGQSLDDPGLSTRLRFDPPLGPMLTRMAQGHEALSQPHARIEIGALPHAQTRYGMLHLGRVADGVLVVITPLDPDRLGGGNAARAAARSAIGMADMLAHEIKNPLAGIQGAAQLLAMNANAQDREDMSEKYKETSLGGLAVNIPNC